MKFDGLFLSKKYIPPAETLYIEDSSNIAFNYLCENSPNDWRHFWNHMSFFLHHPSVSLYIIPLNFFNWKTFLAKTYTLDKNSPSKWNIQTFEWLGENSQNASCDIWHCKSVFPLNFALLFSAMRDNSSVLF